MKIRFRQTEHMKAILHSSTPEVWGWRKKILSTFFSWDIVSLLWESVRRYRWAKLEGEGGGGKRASWRREREGREGVGGGSSRGRGAKGPSWGGGQRTELGRGWLKGSVRVLEGGTQDAGGFDRARKGKRESRRWGERGKEGVKESASSYAGRIK